MHNFREIIISLAEIKFGPGYGRSQQKSEFNSESFFDNLKVISGTILKGQSKEVYSKYEDFLISTDEYLKLETYDFTNRFF